MSALSLDEVLTQRPSFVARPDPLGPEWLTEHACTELAPARPGGDVTVVLIADARLPDGVLSGLPDEVRVVVADRSVTGEVVVPDGVGRVRVAPSVCLAVARNAGAALVTTASVTFALDPRFDARAVALAASQLRGVATTSPPEALPHGRIPHGWGRTLWGREAFAAAGGFDGGRCGHEGVILAHRLLETHGRVATDFVQHSGPALALDGASCPAQGCSSPLAVRSWWVERDFPLLAHTRAALDETVPATLVLDGADQVRRDVIKELAARRRAGWRAADPEERARDPLAAVIVTSFNMTDLLDRAVRSVMSQIQDRVELIVVDDASTDPAARERAAALRDVATVVLREINGGAAAARNSGIAATSAPVVVCLDGDDEITPEFVADVLRVFEFLPTAEIVATHVRYVGDRTDRWRVRDGATVVNALAESPCGVATAFRRQLWEAVGGFDESMRGYEDWEYWIRALDKASVLRAVPRPHFRYRVSATSKVNTSNANADAIVGYITTKHANLYRAHFAEVFAIKHRQVLYARRRALTLSKRSDVGAVPAAGGSSFVWPWRRRRR